MNLIQDSSAVDTAVKDKRKKPNQPPEGGNTMKKLIVLSLFAVAMIAAPTMAQDVVVVENNRMGVALPSGSPTAPLHVSSKNGSGVTALIDSGSLQVQRSDNTANIRFKVSGGAAGTQSWLFQNNQTSGVLAFRDETAGVTPFNFYPNGTALSFVVRNGRWGQGTNNPSHPIHSTTAGGAHLTAGGVWTNGSSRTLKTGIQALQADTALATLAALQPVTYQYKAEPGEGYVGFIAEDVPELVATGDRKTLSPMDVTAVLTRVVQEQQQRLEGQEAMILELRDRLAELEGK